MVYLAIKELSTVAEDVIIVTSSLTKDMTGREEAYCANAIRALCMITDATMLQAIERYMKQAIVDKSHSVSSNALVSSLVSLTCSEYVLWKMETLSEHCMHIPLPPVFLSAFIPLLTTAVVLARRVYV